MTLNMRLGIYESGQMKTLIWPRLTHEQTQDLIAQGPAGSLIHPGIIPNIAQLVGDTPSQEDSFDPTTLPSYALQQAMEHLMFIFVQNLPRRGIKRDEVRGYNFLTGERRREAINDMKETERCSNGYWLVAEVYYSKQK